MDVSKRASYEQPMVDPERYRPELRRIASELERVSDELTERQLRVLRTLRSYDRIPDADLRRSSQRNVHRVVATLSGRSILPAEIEEDEHASGINRALQGVPADDVVAAYRAVLVVLRDAFMDMAAATRIPVEAILVGTRELWELTDRYSSELVAARREIDLDVARRDERQRLAFLQRALTGSLLSSELVQGGAGYGLRPDRQYWVVRARDAETSLKLLSRSIEKVAAGPDFAPLIGPIEGDLAGITVARPVIADSQGLMAVSGPLDLDSLHRGFAEATRALNVAARYNRTGIVDSALLSIRIAVVEEGELGEALFNKYVTSILSESSMATTVLDSVWVLLRSDRQIATAAESLGIHVNTMRYRLEKFEQINGCNLNDTECLIEVWWALEYWAVHRDRVGGTGGRSAKGLH